MRVYPGLPRCRHASTITMVPGVLHLSRYWRPVIRYFPEGTSWHSTSTRGHFELIGSGELHGDSSSLAWWCEDPLNGTVRGLGVATQEGGSRSVSGPEGEVGGGAVCRWASLYVQVGARFEAKCGGIGRWIINSVHVTVDLHTSVSAYIYIQCST